MRVRRTGRVREHQVASASTKRLRVHAPTNAVLDTYDGRGSHLAMSAIVDIAGPTRRYRALLAAQQRTPARLGRKACRVVKAGHRPPPRIVDAAVPMGRALRNGQIDRGVVECVVEPLQVLKWLRRASREVRSQRGGYRQADRFDAQIPERGSGSDGRPKWPLRPLGCCPLSRRCRVRSRGQVR